MFLRFEIKALQKASGVENRSQISYFLTRVEVRTGVIEISESVLPVQSRFKLQTRDLSYTSDGTLLIAV